MRTIFRILGCLMLLATPALAEDTIKLGAFFDLSGRASFIGTPSKLVAGCWSTRSTPKAG
jgi:amino acid/amide ABC transporter substrate-binding protein, HAAT family (TC 3.A.1.4.-)